MTDAGLPPPDSFTPGTAPTFTDPTTGISYQLGFDESTYPPTPIYLPTTTWAAGKARWATWAQAKAAATDWGVAKVVVSL